jgi:5,10-methylene-tetrahydrofolate dehydrogenase/methenyl tetrahydrofolate cyclohydrolase
MTIEMDISFSRSTNISTKDLDIDPNKDVDGFHPANFGKMV